MIHAVDESLRALVRREALAGDAVEVAFDAPTKDWGTRRTTPTVDIYLYDVREDLRRRETGYVDVREEGRVTGRARHSWSCPPIAHGPPSRPSTARRCPCGCLFR